MSTRLILESPPNIFTNILVKYPWVTPFFKPEVKLWTKGLRRFFKLNSTESVDVQANLQSIFLNDVYVLQVRNIFYYSYQRISANFRTEISFNLITFTSAAIFWGFINVFGKFVHRRVNTAYSRNCKYINHKNKAEKSPNVWCGWHKWHLDASLTILNRSWQSNQQSTFSNALHRTKNLERF